ncbi:MAG: TolC family outer membrane protein [Burkholderiales bacterium]|nr:TolC family outer membrane protein [Burkholderiales bacterium]
MTRKRFHSPMARLLLSPVVLLLGLAGQAHAQGLTALYEMARAYDATYLAARAQADAAEYKAAQAQALGLPTLSANVKGVATQIDLPRGASGDNNALQTGLNGRMPLFNKANQATMEQAERSLVAAKAELESAEQDLIIRVAQAYFDVLAAKDNLQLAKTNKTYILEQLASAKRNFEVGTATITDTREAQSRADLAAAQEIAADNDLINRRIALAYLVGRRDVDPLPLITPVVLPTIVPKNVEEWVTVADTVHPQVIRSRVALEVAKLEIQKAKAGELPTIDAVASLGANYATGDSIIPGTTRTGSIGVELNWPLYTGGSVQNRIKETVSLEQRSREEFENARRTVAQNTRVAYFGVQSGEALVKALEAAESSSRLSLEATQLGYRVGVRVNIDVLNAQTQLFQTQRDLFKSRYDVLVNSLRLRQASGQLTPNDLLAVNSLLAKSASN